MIILSVDEISDLHSLLIEKTGGSTGLRDRGLLESAVYSAVSSFGEDEAYPSVEEKSARLMYALTNNHAFVDGNKRIGTLVMLVTLKLNNIKLVYTQEELVTISISVADGTKGYEDILDFINTHKQ